MIWGEIPPHQHCSCGRLLTTSPTPLLSPRARRSLSIPHTRASSCRPVPLPAVPPAVLPSPPRPSAGFKTLHHALQAWRFFMPACQAAITVLCCSVAPHHQRANKAPAATGTAPHLWWHRSPPGPRSQRAQQPHGSSRRTLQPRWCSPAAQAGVQPRAGGCTQGAVSTGGCAAQGGVRPGSQSHQLERTQASFDVLLHVQQDNERSTRQTGARS
jgi:hypothetical protein